MPSWKVSDYVVRRIEAQGIARVYELCGGMLAHLLDSFAKQSAVRVVSMHHEQGAGFAAEGDARMSGLPGVALATSGPGATNLLTAMGSCYFDSSPAVFITGQVNRAERKGERPIRQLGFQETDIVSMARPIAKAAWCVEDPADVPRSLDEAFRIALSGRPGPVLLDLPMDVQREPISAPDPVLVRQTAGPAVDPAAVSQVLELLASAERPLILVGGGVRSGRSAELCRQMAEQLGVPVVHSLMGIDVLESNHPLRVGLIGSYGNRWANHALGESDLLLVVGSRLDIRQTGTDTEGLARRPIVHVDCDAGEIGNRVRVRLPVVAEVGDFARAVLESGARRRAYGAWTERIESQRARWPDTDELKGTPGLNPNLLMRRLGEVSEAAAAFVLDVGQHQMWAGQSLRFRRGQRVLTSGGMGAMGFALPAAIGASLSAGSKSVVVIAGDGGFQLNIQELQTVVRNRLPLKIVIVNNRSHGMVRQFQESYFDSRFQSTVNGYSAPAFARVAEAYGIPSRRLDTEDAPAGPALDNVLEDGLKWLWSDPTSPALLEVGVSRAANALPKLAFGRPITEMEPFAKPLDMEGT